LAGALTITRHTHLARSAQRAGCAKYLHWKAWIDRGAGAVMGALGIMLAMSYESA
jgi:threonine/homoserine/homoserine lactone efflux protein